MRQPHRAARLRGHFGSPVEPSLGQELPAWRPAAPPWTSVSVGVAVLTFPSPLVLWFPPGSAKRRQTPSAASSPAAPMTSPACWTRCTPSPIPSSRCPPSASSPALKVSADSHGPELAWRSQGRPSSREASLRGSPLWGLPKLELMLGPRKPFLGKTWIWGWKYRPRPTPACPPSPDHTAPRWPSPGSWCRGSLLMGNSHSANSYQALALCRHWGVREGLQEEVTSTLGLECSLGGNLVKVGSTERGGCEAEQNTSGKVWRECGHLRS